MTVAVKPCKCLITVRVCLGPRKHLRGKQAECLKLMSPENLPLPDSGLATQGDSLVQCANVQSFSLEEKQELLLVMQHGKRRIKLGHSSLIHSRFPVE